jgi:AAA+ ATPase superfamily predicted ATPase
MFHNRTRELNRLRDALEDPRAQLFIVYGRRGVGKSALLTQAVIDRPHIYYRASRRTLPIQLEELTATVRETYSEQFVPDTFTSTDEFLRFLADRAAQNPRDAVVVVIDELPYLAQSDPGLLTAIQHWWDANKGLANLRIFLTGSYVSFMEREVLSLNAPLYNRRTGAMHLQPLTYLEAAEFFPGYSPRQRIEAYAVLGGLPSYLEQFDADRSLDENLLRTVLRPNTYLNQEPEWLLLQDLRSDIVYGSILRAIASGRRKPSEIAQAIGRRSAQDVAPQLEMLQALGLVTRQVSVTDRKVPRSRRSLYWLADNYLAFWYRYVDPLGRLIVQDRGDLALARIKESFHEFVAIPPWEDVCRQYLWRALAREALPEGIEFTELGPWWDDQSEIDIIALDGSKASLAGSCKWTNAPMTTRDLYDLQSAVSTAAGTLDPLPAIWYALFSREGFEPVLQTIAANPSNRILLLTVDDLFAI